MGIYKIIVLITGVIIVLYMMSSYKTQNIENDKILYNVNTNKDNINQIKNILQNLQSPPSSSNNINEKINSINNNVQKIEQLYEMLSQDLQSLKQRKKENSLSFSEKNNLINSLLDTDAPVHIPLTPTPESIQQQDKTILLRYENEWQSADNDTTATITTQDELDTIFSSSNEYESEITVSNVECKINTCKVSLSYPSDTETTPILKLMEQDSFSDKDIYYKENENSNTKKTEMTLYIKKTTEEENNTLQTQ